MHWLRTSGTLQLPYLMNPDCQIYERIKYMYLEKNDKLYTDQKGKPQLVLLRTVFWKGIGKIWEEYEASQQFLIKMQFSNYYQHGKKKVKSRLVLKALLKQREPTKPLLQVGVLGLPTQSENKRVPHSYSARLPHSAVSFSGTESPSALHNSLLCVDVSSMHHTLGRLSMYLHPKPYNTCSGQVTCSRKNSRTELQLRRRKPAPE